MTKEQLGPMLTIIALLLGMLGSFFHFGSQIGTLTAQIQAQTEQIRILQGDLRGINSHLIQWVQYHETPERNRR